MARYLAAQDGRLASERIIDTLEGIVQRGSKAPMPTLRERLDGNYQATKRRLVKNLKGLLPHSKYRPEFQRLRYPGLSLGEMRERVARYQRLLGDIKPLAVEKIADHVFRICA